MKVFKVFPLFFLPALCFAEALPPSAALSLAASAAQTGDVAALRILIRKQGVSPSAMVPNKGRPSPLIFLSKNLKTARFLFNEGSPPTSPDGKTMVMRAAAEGDAPMMKFFLKHNNARARDGEGWTALHYLATGSGKPALADTLLKEGIPVNAATSDLWTPLMFAAQRGNAPLAALLLARGADASLRNDEKKTALGLAKELLPFAVKKESYREIIRLLQGEPRPLPKPGEGR